MAHFDDCGSTWPWVKSAWVNSGSVISACGQDIYSFVSLILILFFLKKNQRQPSYLIKLLMAIAVFTYSM